MAYSLSNQKAGDKKLLDPLIADLITLSYECKRKYQPIKEAAEACQLKVRGIGARSENVIAGLLAVSTEIIQPFVMGCDTKNPKIVQMSLAAIQRLISQQTVDEEAAQNIVSSLWLLMEGRVEELKLLQTAILLITTNSVVKHETLSKALALCFRMHFAKDSTTTHTAAATVRQLVSAVFDRAVVEDAIQIAENLQSFSLEELKTGNKNAPKSLRPYAGDAFLLFQDFCQLLNADQPYWLLGMTEMTRALCLELMEEVLTNYISVFLRHPEFTFLLSEKVCPHVIKLFSPSIKYRACKGSSSPSVSIGSERPFFPIVIRLLRIVSVLIQHYYTILPTECEIFLSLLVKFLDPEKTTWQRTASLEVIGKLSLKPALIRNFCESYDMKPHSTKILRDIITSIGVFIQSQFINPSHATTSSTSSSNIGVKPADNNLQVTVSPPSNMTQPQIFLFYRNIWVPLVLNIGAPQGSNKSVILEMLDKSDAPNSIEGYGLSLAFLCILDVVKSIQSIIPILKTPSKSSLNSSISSPISPVIPDGSSNSQVPVMSSSADVSSTPPSSPSPNSAVVNDKEDANEKSLHDQLIMSSWCGILSALTLLLEASTDDQVNESILSSLTTFAALCGSVGIVVARDAFVTSLCKASLPAHYSLQALGGFISSSSGGSFSSSGSIPGIRPSQSDLQTPYNEPIQSSQVVVVGTALLTGLSNQNASQGPVMLTAKNVHCMKSLLEMSMKHGSLLGTSWNQVLATLQHLVWILGLKPTASGSMKASQQASDNVNSVITTSIMSDLPFLSTQLTQLFESSRELDDVSLHHMVSALCKLSSESMDVGYTNREPSLFAVAKLLETGLVNLSRVEVVWRPITGHLLEACQHPHSLMRTWAAESITMLIKSAFTFKHNHPLCEQPKLQTKLLTPLQDLNGITHVDIRQKQLDCVLQVIQNFGEHLCDDGWSLILNILGSVNHGQSESLIRSAFQGLQLVVTDFLLTLPCHHLQLCVEVVAMFGVQNQELNISLTAVGLLWNIADHFSQNRLKIKTDLEKRDENEYTPLSFESCPSKMTQQQSSLPLPPFDNLWMSLYLRLGQLCVDQRPAVRKSAGQTLFSMIGAHGWLLQYNSWHTMLWKILFPLLENVKCLTNQAAENKMDASGKSGNILMHHSRDTAEKQWAETRFLTLAGIVRVVSIKRKTLQMLGDFKRAWALLLEYIEDSALCRNAEVSLAALKSFQELLNINHDKDPQVEESIVDGETTAFSMYPPNENKSDKLFPDKDFRIETSQSIPFRQQENVHCDFPSQNDGDAETMAEVDELTLWIGAWRVWRNIGVASTSPSLISSSSSSLPLSTETLYVPSQAFLTALVQTFPGLYIHIRGQFVTCELQKLFQVLQKALCVPVHSSSSSFFILSNELSLTTLQEVILESIKLLVQDGLNSFEIMSSTYPELFERMIPFIEYSINTPKPEKPEDDWNSKLMTNGSGSNKGDWILANFVPFSEAIIKIIIEMYGASANNMAVIKTGVCRKIIKALKLPLLTKYKCPSKSTWSLSIKALLSVLKTTLPIARRHEDTFLRLITKTKKAQNKIISEKEFHDMWFELGLALEGFMFSTHPTPSMLSVAEFEKDEALDCHVIETIRDEILPYSKKLPDDFVAKIISILNKGSIHSIKSSNFLETDSTNKLREEFAKVCFETLLQFSFVHNQFNDKKSGKTDETCGMITNLAIESLLERCSSVLLKYIEDTSHCGNFPLPRAQMTEVSFILQAIATLLITLKKNPSVVSNKLWREAIKLYPHLVNCASCAASSNLTSKSLSTNTNLTKVINDALMEYMDLLQPPPPSSFVENGLSK